MMYHYSSYHGVRNCKRSGVIHNIWSKSRKTWNFYEMGDPALVAVNNFQWTFSSYENLLLCNFCGNDFKEKPKTLGLGFWIWNGEKGQSIFYRLYRWRTYTISCFFINVIDLKPNKFFQTIIANVWNCCTHSNI